MTTRVLLVTGFVLWSATTASAFILGLPGAPVTVTDPAVTAENETTAGIKDLIVEVVTDTHTTLRRMARRLAVFTDLRRYVAEDAPRWRTRWVDPPQAEPMLAYMFALNGLTPAAAGFAAISTPRADPTGVLASLPAAGQTYLRNELATLDLADSTIIAGTDQTGRIRGARRAELAALTQLEQHVIDDSGSQSTTAILDKISAGALLRARQQETRLQLMLAVVEQLVVNTKRARDTEAEALRMQRYLHDGEESPTLLNGVTHDLRMWRQP